MEEIQRAIDRTSDAAAEKVDWNKAWGKKYPILLACREQVDAGPYAQGLAQLLDKLKREQGYSELDAMLVLKDILARVWQERKKG